MLLRHSIIAVSTLLFSNVALSADWQSLSNSPNPNGRAVLLETFTLPPVDIAEINPGVDLGSAEAAIKNGYAKRTNPGIGSGLVQVPGEPGNFYFLTDRGPNFDSTSNKGKIFPLPEFSPAIVKAKLENGRIIIEKSVPLTDEKGRSVTGLPNNSDVETPYAANGGNQLAYRASGLDAEALQVLPDGRFIISEEYGPSIIVADASGKVLVRYVPEGRAYANADYPTKATLPGILKNRRQNRGFENLAVSPDGKTAWAVLQSPMGDSKHARIANSRVVRAIRLDISDPLNAKVDGMFAVLQSPKEGYPDTGKQGDLKYSDAAFLGQDKLLLLERATNRVKLIVADFSGATNLLKTSFENSLDIEDAYKPIEKSGVVPATVSEVFDSRHVIQIDTDKLEGLAIINPSVVMLVNDNDFGVGENVNDYPTHAWLIRLGKDLNE